MATKYLREEIVEKFIEKHGSKYDYSKVSYSGIFNKIIIICKIHGEFEQIAKNHLDGKGCAKCSKRFMDTQYFVECAKKIHNNKYDYSKTVFVCSKEKLIIICKKHGEFKQNSDNHLHGSGCFKCFGSSKNTDKVIVKKFQKVHGKKYNYEFMKYNGINQNINILCSTHGIFSQRPAHHLAGAGCPTCCESKGEKAIRQWLLLNEFEFESQKKFKDCVFKKELPFDFYLPHNNLCIEFDGLQHSIEIKRYGGVEGLKLRKTKDYIKNEYCKAKNINLLRVDYKQLYNIPSILSKLLL